MSERHEPVTIEERLDRYIDLSKAGAQRSIPTNDELQDLALTVETIRAHAAIEQAERDGFPRGMAEVLGKSLRGPEAQHSARNFFVPTAPANGSLPPTNTAMGTQPADWERLDDRKQTSRTRQILQLAAGIAGLAIVATILALVFRPGGDSGIIAPGIDDSDDLILYSAGERDAEDIFVIDPDTGEETNLTDSPAIDISPSWSPDGQRIAFYSNRDNNDGSHDLYLMDADGSNVQKLADGPMNDSAPPAWSPDGERIAFIAIGEDPVAGSDLQTVRADGSDLQTVYSVEPSGGNSAVIFGPISWSVDSSRLVVRVSTGDGMGGTAIVDTDSGLESILNGTTEAVWSPAENRLLLIQPSGLGEQGIYLAGPDGSNREMLLPLEDIDQAISPAWSADGSQVLVSIATADLARDMSLVKLDARSGEQQDLGGSDAERPAITGLAGSPDGERIAYIASAFPSEDAGETPAQQIRVMNSDGSEIRELSTDPPVSPPQWRPGSDTSTPETDDQTEELTPAPDLTEQLTPPAGEEEPATPEEPSINVVPYELTCDSSAAVTGSGFVPGSTVDVYPGEQSPEAPGGSAIASAEVDADGSFEVDGLTPAGDLIPNCEEMAANGGGDVVLSVASITDDDGGTGYSDIITQPAAILTPIEDSDSAAITLDPPIGDCLTPVSIAGRNFEPGTQVSFAIGRPQSHNPAILDTPATVQENGSFATEQVDLTRGIPECREGEIPEVGIRYRAWTQTGTRAPDDPYREPSAWEAFTLIDEESTFTTKEMLEDLMFHTANAAIIEFLQPAEPRLTLVEVDQDGDFRIVRLQQEIDGVVDEFAYDVDRGEVTGAWIPSHSSLHAEPNPINEDQAFEIAESVAIENYNGFDQLTLYETSDQDTVPGADDEDRVYSATWQLRANDTVWVPTQLRVQVNLETGLLQSYSFNHEPYRGPLEPAIPEQQALDIAQDRIDTDPTLEGAAIGEVELTTSYVALEMDENGNVTSGEWVLTWRVHLENEPEEAPAPYLDINAVSGEMLTDTGMDGAG